MFPNAHKKKKKSRHENLFRTETENGMPTLKNIKVESSMLKIQTTRLWAI